MKTHVLLLAKTFPAKHPKAGQPTYFKEKMHNGLLWDKGENVGYSLNPSYAIPGGIQLKLHTIRANYERWKKIIDEVNRGEAVLSVREWSGVPYRSTQVEIFRFTKDDHLGCQKLEIRSYDYDPVFWGLLVENRAFVSKYLMANYDGLIKQDWINWFKLCDLSKPLAIIFFADFRY